MARKSKQEVLVSYDLLPIFETLIKKGKAQAAAEITVAIIRYDKDGIEPDFIDESVSFVWESVIKPKLDANKEAYEEVAKSRREAVSSRYNQNEQMNTNATNEYKCNNCIQNEQMNTNATDKDKDKDKDKDNILNNLNRLFVPQECDEAPKEDKKYQPIIDAWNKLPVTPIRSISGTRLKMLQARIKQYSFEDVLKAIENVRASPFLLGRKTEFQITFDWLVKPNNFTKVLEGNYLERESVESEQKEKNNKQFAEYAGVDFQAARAAYEEAKKNGETMLFGEFLKAYREKGETNGNGDA